MLTQRIASSMPRRTSVRSAPSKKAGLAVTGGWSAISFQNWSISRGDFPAAIRAALMPPADVPEITAGPRAKRGSSSSRS